MPKEIAKHSKSKAAAKPVAKKAMPAKKPAPVKTATKKAVPAKMPVKATSVKPFTTTIFIY